MAEFELNIYGKDDEIINRYETNFVRWGVYMQAMELQKDIKGKTDGQKFIAINQFMKKIFPSLTDDDLENADGADVLNTFTQLIKKTNKIKTGDTEKNVDGAE